MKKFLFAVIFFLVPMLILPAAVPGKRQMSREQMAQMCFGRIAIVPNGEDFRVKIVWALPDASVKIVETDNQCKSPYHWRFVAHHEQYKIRFVDSGEDFTIRFTVSSPGPR